MGSISRSPAELNRIMSKVVPELDSEYAKYPLKRAQWLNYNGKGPNGESCYLSSQQDAGIKKDYVFCKNGPRGPGYYHLLCKVSYVNLYSRIHNSPPVACCAFSAESKQAYEDWDDIKRVVFNRQTSPRPDDAFGAQKAINDARGLTRYEQYY